MSILSKDRNRSRARSVRPELRHSWLALLTSHAVLFTGCGGESPDPDPLAGVANLAITGAPGVGSVRIDFTGATRSVSRCVAVDGQITTTLDRLPTGPAVGVDGAAFADAACGGTATWFAEPQTVAMQPGRPTPITIRFRPNGVGDIGVDFEPDELPHCEPAMNLALGASAELSDNGWGGGARKADLTDGLTEYCDTWAHGLAATGGPSGWAGAACGERQWTIDLGANNAQSVSVARVYHHGDYHIPATARLEGSLDGSSWFAIADEMTLRNELRTDATCPGAVPTEHRFAPGTLRFFRYRFNNCEMMFPTSDSHGWSYEIELYEACQ